MSSRLCKNPNRLPHHTHTHWKAAVFRYKTLGICAAVSLATRQKETSRCAPEFARASFPYEHFVRSGFSPHILFGGTFSPARAAFSRPLGKPPLVLSLHAVARTDTALTRTCARTECRVDVCVCVCVCYSFYPPTMLWQLACACALVFSVLRRRVYTSNIYIYI